MMKQEHRDIGSIPSPSLDSDRGGDGPGTKVTERIRRRADLIVFSDGVQGPPRLHRGDQLLLESGPLFDGTRCTLVSLRGKVIGRLDIDLGDDAYTWEARVKLPGRCAHPSSAAYTDAPPKVQLDPFPVLDCGCIPFPYGGWVRMCDGFPHDEPKEPSDYEGFGDEWTDDPRREQSQIVQGLE